MKDTEKKVFELLEHYGEKKRQLKQLQYELTHPQLVSPEEVIEAMALPGSVGDSTSSHQISDRTMYISLNYQGRASALNQEYVDGIYNRLAPLELELDRLDHYIGLLELNQASVIRLFYMEHLSISELSAQIKLSERTLRRMRGDAISELAHMYELAGELQKNSSE